MHVMQVHTTVKDVKSQVYHASFNSFWGVNLTKPATKVLSTFNNNNNKERYRTPLIIYQTAQPSSSIGHNTQPVKIVWLAATIRPPQKQTWIDLETNHINSVIGYDWKQMMVFVKPETPAAPGFKLEEDDGANPHISLSVCVFTCCVYGVKAC